VTKVSKILGKTCKKFLESFENIGTSFNVGPAYFWASKQTANYRTHKSNSA